MLDLSSLTLPTLTLPSDDTDMLTPSSSHRVLTERLSKFLKASSKADYREFYSTCIQLARLIDMAVVKNQKPSFLHDVTQLLRKICEQKDNDKFQPAVMVLLLSLKNTIHLGWFGTVERQELLNMSKELLGFFAGMGGLSNVDNMEATQFISSIIPRFYPSLNLQSVVVALEAKPGYETMLVDFYVLKKPSASEELRLFVIRKDSQDTSACLVTPNHVNFLVNGKGVEKRSLASMDTGPQMPTNLTGMLKIGTNLLQIVGDFSGSYMIVIALTGTATESSSPLLLQIYSPGGVRTGSDDDLIEGPSRVSLRCPISHKRITSPVKGSSCKHHQCFDYHTFMEINSRRPSWKCPYCNRHISFPDLRLDLQMLKVLKETEESAIDVMVSGDGSWEVLLHEDTVTENMAVSQMSRRKELNSRNSSGESSAEEGEIRCEKLSSALIDLSDDDEQRIHANREYVEHCDSFGVTNRSMHGEFDDRKPDVSHIYVSASESLTNVDGYSPGVSRSTLLTQDSARISESSELSSFVTLPPNVTDSSASLSQWLESTRDENFVTTSRVDVSASLSAVALVNTDLSSFHAVQAIPAEGPGFGVCVSSEALSERQLNREVSRSPIAIQALPAQTSILNPNFRPRSHSNSQPNSPAQAVGTPHSNNLPSSQVTAHPNLAQIVPPTFIVQEGQLHSTNAGHQHAQQDNLCMLDIPNTNLIQQVPSGQTQISESFDILDPWQRYNIQTWQPNRVTQPSSQLDQRVSTDLPYATSPSSERQNLHQQQVSFQQTTRQDSFNLLNSQFRQQARFPAAHAQQMQQIQNLASNVSNTYREESINSGFSGVAEGVPMYNQSSNGSMALVGSSRRQPSQGARAVTSQYTQSSNNPLIVPNTGASRDQRWVSSSEVVSIQPSDISTMLLSEQNQRPVARMRGSITSSGRASAVNVPPSQNPVTPMNYGWMYGVPSQPPHLPTISPLGNTNQPARFIPVVPPPWSNEMLRQWGPSRSSAGLGTSLQSNQTSSDFLNSFETQSETAMPLQGTASLFDAGDLSPL